jgi:FKBP-type peptidyl-prolyl cis-trans isomerase FklB
MKTTREKVSYCIGLETGKNLKQQFVDIDFERLREGFHDAIAEAGPQLAEEEIRSILTSLKEQIDAQQRRFVAKVADENRKAGDAFLAENRTKEGVQTTPSGLQYTVLSSGNGPLPSSIDVVTVHYHGYFLDGRLFDSSYTRGQPHTFPVNRAIAGWAEALQMMHVGDKWRLFVPSYLAYGEMGLPNQIGPNLSLIFEIELVAIS